MPLFLFSARRGAAVLEGFRRRDSEAAADILGER